MKVIIIYATKYGSTEETAKRIRSQLGAGAELCNVMTGDVPPLDGFDTVVLGGSIYAGKLQKQMTGYVDRHLPELLRKRVGIFLCAAQQTEETRLKELETAFPAQLLQHACVKDVLGFAFDFQKMGFLEKAIIKKIKGDDHSMAVYYDDKIAQFAKTVTSEA